jgi:hypothetical protein
VQAQEPSAPSGAADDPELVCRFGPIVDQLHPDALCEVAHLTPVHVKAVERDPAESASGREDLGRRVEVDGVLGGSRRPWGPICR